ncbi:MAG: Tm-1-like ATP-binding domain-containing protein [Actinobacteria bacterium]|nr:Tm-1-like ATP-binding domain-containing protein [Actinomycetota bacterium]
MKKTIAILGCMDTKGQEYAFIKRYIKKEGLETLVIDIGIIGKALLKPDITKKEIADAAGKNFDKLIKNVSTREEFTSIMSEGAKKIVTKLASDGRIDGIISCGGTQGTTMATNSMRALPVGFPKVMVSTIASGNTLNFVGIKDITMINSVADILGLNRITRKILREAAGAICGMVKISAMEDIGGGSLIAITNVGITTPGTVKAKEVLEKSGFETVVFHAVGTGGMAMESIIKEGQINAVLDFATIEVIQEMCGGILASKPERMTNAAKMGIPQVICPGGISCNTFSPHESIPQRLKNRRYVRHNPMFTNVQNNAEEFKALAIEQAKRVNPSKGPVKWFIPMKGFCSYSIKGQPFYDPEANNIYVETLKKELREDIPVNVLDLDINDPIFATKVAESLIDMISES